MDKLHKSKFDFVITFLNYFNCVLFLGFGEKSKCYVSFDSVFLNNNNEKREYKAVFIGQIRPILRSTIIRSDNALCYMHYAICIMLYTLCYMHYAICTMFYAIC